MKTTLSIILLLATLIATSLLSSCKKDTPSPLGPGPAPTAPAAPSNLQAKLPSSTSIILEWQDTATNETGFGVEQSLSQFSGFAEVAETGADVTSTSIAGLSPNTMYYFRVFARNAVGSSPYSNTANETTTSGGTGTVPNAPSGLSATATGQTSISISWTDNANNESGFKIERSLSSNTGFAQVATASANATSRSMTGLSAGTRYYFRVRAYNGTGDSGYSNTADATTNGGTGTVPNAPSGLSATATGQTSISISWTDNANNESGLKIEQSLSSNTGFAQVATASANATSRSMTGLSAGTRYYFRVRAYNGTGDSGYSNTADTITNTPQPSAPVLSGPSGSVTDGQHFNLTWTYNWAPCTVCPSTSGYRLEESSTSSSSGFAQIWESYLTGDRQSPRQLVITPRPAGTYWYRVRAFDNGWSNYSNVIQVTVTAVPVAATRFVNNTSYALISLKINGQEQFPVSPMGLLPGQWFEIELSPGTYSVSAANGFWDGSSRFILYTWSGNFTQQAGTTGEVRFNDATIAQLLTQFGSSRLWEASYWVGTTPHVAGWRFYSNGTARFYIDGVDQGSTAVSLVQRNPGGFNVVFKVGNYEGTLWETFGWFGMWNGPGGSALQYWPVSTAAASPTEGPLDVPLGVTIRESIR